MNVHHKALQQHALRCLMLMLSAIVLPALSVTAQELHPLTLTDALAKTLADSPALAPYPWDIRIAEAEKLQAGLRPNPELSLEVEGLRWTPGAKEITEDGGSTEIAEGAGSGLSEAEFTLALSQVVELGGKRAQRIRLAEKGIAVARWEYETARADVLANTARDFGAVLAAQQGAALSEALLHFAEKTRAITAAQVEAGQLSPLGLRKATLEVTAAQIEYRQKQGALEAARAALSANWGAGVPDFGTVLGSFGELRPLPDLEQLHGQIHANPDLARWVDALALRDAEIALARAERNPDLELTLGLRAEKLRNHWTRTLDGGSVTEVVGRPERDWDTSLVLEVALPLPVFDRNQGNIQAVHYARQKSVAERKAARAGILASLAEHHILLSLTAAEVSTLEDEAIPEATATFELTQEGFKQGKFNYLEVLDAQRTLFELQVHLLAAKTTYHQGWVEIDRLIGAHSVAAIDAGEEQ